MSGNNAAIQEMSEFALISRILAGDAKMFHDLVRPHEIAVYLAAFSVLGNPEEAERAAQNTVWHGFLNLKMFIPGESFRIWLLERTLYEARRIRDTQDAGLRDFS